MPSENIPTGRAIGGVASRAKLTPEERSASASKAALAKAAMSKLPKATHFGSLKIGETEIICFVLDDGRRVISGRGLTSAIGMKGRGQGAARIAGHKLLKHNESNDLSLAIETPIKFVGRSPKGANATSDGYEAIVLQEVCESILTARDKGLLASDQDKRYAVRADILMRGFARVGIVALVDEATGYQKDRAKDALAKVLEAFVAKELQPWVKTFPADYYEQLFRLYHIPFPPEGKPQWRPSFFGHITNDVVYARLAPELLPELKKAASKAARKARLHQWLINEMGHPKLREHLASIVTLMRISKTPDQFKGFVDQAHPRFGETITFDFNG